MYDDFLPPSIHPLKTTHLFWLPASLGSTGICMWEQVGRCWCWCWKVLPQGHTGLYKEEGTINSYYTSDKCS